MAKLAEGKRSFTLTMETDDYNKIAKISEQERRSVTFIINEAIKDYLKKKKAVQLCAALNCQPGDIFEYVSEN